jgi:hypothetical protein
MKFVNLGVTSVWTQKNPAPSSTLSPCFTFAPVELVGDPSRSLRINLVVRFRSRQDAPRCGERPGDAPHPRRVRPLLLRGEDRQQRARRLHGHRSVRPGRQHEPIAR